MPWYVLLGYVIGFSIIFFICAILIDLVRRKIEDVLYIKLLIKQIGGQV